MFKFILRRVLWSIPVLLLVIFLTFLLMKAIPGGPFTSEKSIPAGDPGEHERQVRARPAVVRASTCDTSTTRSRVTWACR